MVSDGIKIARIQAWYSPLIGLTWEPVRFPVNIRSVIKNARTRLSSPWGGPPVGRHAAPGRSFAGRHAAR